MLDSENKKLLSTRSSVPELEKTEDRANFSECSEFSQEKMREQRGTLRALVGICQFHLVIFRNADVHGNVVPVLVKSIDRASVRFVLSAVEY